MDKNYYEFLCCPECRSSLELNVKNEDAVGIKDGNLLCNNCSKQYPILNYIPRFVDKENYASSFGYEWNKYSKLRSDKYNKSDIIKSTIDDRSGWNETHLKGKFLLECGCGAGNDTEVLLNKGAKVISFDYSNSVESAFENNKMNKDLLILQADIYKIPVNFELFDVVYCHRVIQHTPDPENAFYSMIKHLKKSGEMFLHSYDANIASLFHYKYLLRYFTKNMDYHKVLKLLKRIGPFLYPFVGKLKQKKNKLLNTLLPRFIPFDNYDLYLEKYSAHLTKREKYEYSLLNTFDALTPKYDNPNSAKEIVNWFKKAGFKDIIVRQRNPVIIVAFKS